MASSPVAVRWEGTGPEALLVHGGASPSTTWAGLERLARRWRLGLVHRRGYPPSPPPPGGRQDFEVDAADVAALLDERPHLVGHSYGGLVAVLAATRRPDRVRSLTLIEPPIFLPPDDPEVERFRRLGDEVLTNGLAAPPDALREFLTVAGAPVDEGPLPEDVVRGVLRAHGARRPSEATLDLPALRAAGVPTLVASGGHAGPLERMADALAEALAAERVVAPGAGHFVAAAPGFADRLDAFLSAVSGDRRAPA